MNLHVVNTLNIRMSIFNPVCLSIMYLHGWMEAPLAKARKVGWILFLFCIQRFIHHRPLPVNMNILAPIMGVLQMCSEIERGYSHEYPSNIFN
jgi:hypothetical protein